MMMNKIMEIMNNELALEKIDSNRENIVITGVTGQDGSIMSDYILKNTNFNVIGGARRLSVENHLNINHLNNNPRFCLVNFDLTDTHSINNIVSKFSPKYFINCAAQTFVKSSWEFPVQTWETNTTGVLHCLEAIRQYSPNCKMYNCGSSEEWGNVIYTPQDEKHPLRPRSPYGASKVGARQLIKVYRESYNLFAIQSWLLNHESTRRGKEFVTRKITSNVAKIHHSILHDKEFLPIELGNLDANRDWSDAEDCVDAIWKMINNPSPVEYVVSSGEAHSIREFVEIAFSTVGICGEWRGSGISEIYYYTNPLIAIPDNRRVLVKINPNYYRPAEVSDLCGNSLKIKSELGWFPKTTFSQLIKKMVIHDINSLK